MVAIIGDIHGCYYTLLDLYSKIREKYNKIPIYSVGDLVDRGNYSYDVVKFVLEEKILFTPGNHDYMFYHFFKDPSSVFARSWIFNGSEKTLESYEEHEEALFSHIDSIKKAPLYYNLDDCFISHAGISSIYQNHFVDSLDDDLTVLNEQVYKDFRSDSGVLWTRDELLNLGKLQVVGHTKHQEIVYDESSNTVYIDTGACVGNTLSAVIVEQNNIEEVISQKTHLNDII
ncbi:MAG: metallophosphoesterase [Melioribacteraceae bacterium]|nr:metallophosphoesterase [Melioribacteraceae bacterium]